MALVSASDLAAELDSVTLLDVRWELATGPQPAAYAAGHIPGAVFVDLDRDLAAPPGPRGRHPLPAAEAFTAAMRRAGVSPNRPVVLYDDGAKGMAAARGWWVLRYYGHPDVRVLDGGLRAWVEAGGRLKAGVEVREEGSFTAEPGHMPVLDADGAAALAHTGLLLDARAPERYRGDTEPLDPVAGHIPGAQNSPVSLDIDDSGRLRHHPERDIDPATRVGVYCGSGVSAAQKVLALELAGIRAALYPGSWSEWVTDPSRPIATGDEP